MSPFAPRGLLVLAALAASSALWLALLGPLGLLPYVGCWMLAAPYFLAPLRGALRAEALGVLALFGSAASLDYLDDLLGYQQRVTLALVVCTIAYAVQRRREAREIVRSPALLLLGAFFAQQIWSAAVFNPGEVWSLLQNRVSVLATVVAGAALMRRERGQLLLPALGIVGALVSVPVMIWEVAHPDQVLFPSASIIGPVRAGGLFAQPNNVGCAISFAAAFLLALRTRAQLSRGVALWLGGALGLGLLACASRGAMLVVAALGGASIWVAAARRAGRPPLVGALVVSALLVMVLPPIGQAAAALSDELQDRGIEQADRLGEVLLALSGRPDDLVDDDSSRGTPGRRGARPDRRAADLRARHAQLCRRETAPLTHAIPRRVGRKRPGRRRAVRRAAGGADPGGGAGRAVGARGRRVLARRLAAHPLRQPRRARISPHGAAARLRVRAAAAQGGRRRGGADMNSRMGPPFDDIGGLLDQLRREDPARPALSFYRGRELDGRMSYGELLARVEQFAGALCALGVRGGDRVAVLAPNRLEIPPLYLALWRLGAAVVPLNPGAPDEDWRQVLARSQACGLIATRERLATHERPAPGFARSLEDLAGGEKAPEIRARATGPAIILYTSGTTASPKGVTLAQRNLICNAWSMARNFRLRHTTQLAVLPLFHAHALGFGMMSALTTGGHLVLTEKLDPFTWAEVIRAENVEFTSVVPSLLPLLLGARVTREKVPSLRALLVSSAPLARERAREFEDKTGIPLIQGWGLSEYTNFACCVSPV